MNTGHIDVNRYNAITAANYRIGVMIITATIGTTAHRYDPTRFTHLIVNTSESGRHLISERSRDYYHIGLSWTRSEDDPKPVHIITRGRDVHHFDCTTGEAKGQRPQRVLSRPIQQIIHSGQRVLRFTARVLKRRITLSFDWN